MTTVVGVLDIQTESNVAACLPGAATSAREPQGPVSAPAYAASSIPVKVGLASLPVLGGAGEEQGSCSGEEGTAEPWWVACRSAGPSPGDHSQGR